MITLMSKLVTLEENLNPFFHDDFEKELFSAALKNLKSRNPLAFNNFAYALRELIRHFLHRLAPDEEIIKCSWYKPISDQMLTRADRLKYIIHGGLGKFILEKIYVYDRIQEALETLTKKINLLSKFTHVNPDTFNLKHKDKILLSIECLSAVKEVVELINETRQSVFEMIMEEIDDALNMRVAMDYVDNIDELSSHTTVDEIFSEVHNGISITSDNIKIQVQGTIGCNLQYGSRSDDGCEIYMSFPFNVPVTIKIKQPLGEHLSLGHLHVNTRKFYE